MKILKISGYIILVLIGIIILTLGFSYRPDISAGEAEKKYLTPESEIISVMDAMVHIRDRGEGVPVFLIHGSFASLHTWDAWESVLAKKYRTISMDLPGHGLTGPNSSQVYSQNYYRDLVFAIADTLKIDTFYVAGNSMGGNVALRMALERPARIKKLILVDAAGALPASQKDSVIKNTATSVKGRPWIFNVIAHPVGGKLMTSFTPRYLFKLNLKQVYGNQNLITDALTDRYYELLRREGNRAATLKRLSGGMNLTGQSENQEINCPTLIIWGEKDRWIPLKNGELLNSRIRNSKLVVFPQAGHVPHEEIPNETVQVVYDFLQFTGN
jgi:pimeloyl-ACP methyl ester carboxylesterase